MKKKLLLYATITLLLINGFAPWYAKAATTLSQRLSGRILLQVQAHGEAWYVEPITLHRYYLGRPADAYALMRSKGLGIRHDELLRYLSSRFPSRLSGRILLDVENHGEAFYVLPASLTGQYLGRAEDAYALMRGYGLGITSADLSRIPVAIDSAPLPNGNAVSPPNSPSNVSELERKAFELVNSHRTSIGRGTLTWNNAIADIARAHSEDMAAGRVPFGHVGFKERADAIQAATGLRTRVTAENVALNNARAPADSAVDQWLDSPSHRESMENEIYNQTGMGVARSADGIYYFTQLFIGI